jgi:hypothetical protein
LDTRKGFSLINSPLNKLKQNLLSKSQINHSKIDINTQSKVKESKVKESKREENKVEESIVEEIKRKYNIGEEIKSIFNTIPDILKLIEKSDMDAIERREKYLFNLHYSTILDYQKIKI